jgi:class 3 adenylate cyclase
MEAQRSLLTLLFTDIVGSTDLVERLGDEAWRALLVRHHEIVRTQLAIFRGHEIDHAGDGFFVTFDRPGQAVRFAQAVRDALGAIGIAVRCGIHAGECEQIDGQVLGVAVHVAARVAGMARPGEILVSGTVKDLLAGSGFEFGNRGWHTLKGLRERRQLHSLGSPAAMPAVERPRVGARRAFALVR